MKKVYAIAAVAAIFVIGVGIRKMKIKEIEELDDTREERVATQQK